MYIKICGITRKEDRDAALNSGVSALGFIAYPKSPRYVSPERVKELLEGVGQNVDKVAVFVNASLDEIAKYVDAGVNIIQLHGSEPAEFAEKVAKTSEVWKAMALRSEDDIVRFKNYPADKYLIDAYCEVDHGGTGKVADWDLAEEAVALFDVPVLLAGGITSENVHDAVEKVKPYGLDLSSGVEIRPGIKDHALIKQFISVVNQ